jgi:hypothetical protein
VPEVPTNIDMTTGNLGLTDEEENQIVKFLETLSDGFTKPYPNLDTFTGACTTGGSAATQGNESLIPTPSLPPCAAVICGVEPFPKRALSAMPGAPEASLNARAARVWMIEGPKIELATDHLTIITWTTNNPGGSPVHYGIAHYGTGPNDLSQTASSPIRLNPEHSSTVFRVRLENLEPRTTYYYRVDSIEANGESDRVTSPVRRFSTR